ncbi:hypothetical protein CASFOL_040495 [Castilleja foliolosa]|uniref:Uncharacterized protein n=1 Tax=Castilleja foliolosa TaxID=1961234 RepID=A0ABD3BC43_9LAMI
MTTAARPTWAPAKGGNEQGGTRIFGPSQKYSSRDIAAHTTLKPRKEGQDTQDELQRRNLRDELEDRERRHFSSKEDRERRKGGHLLLEVIRRDIEDRIIPRSVDADDADVEAQTDDSEDDEDDDDGDDEEALLAELERLRREKAEQKEREAISTFGSLASLTLSFILFCLQPTSINIFVLPSSWTDEISRSLPGKLKLH